MNRSGNSVITTKPAIWGWGRDGVAVLQRKRVTGKAEEKARKGRDSGVLQANDKVQTCCSSQWESHPWTAFNEKNTLQVSDPVQLGPGLSQGETSPFLPGSVRKSLHTRCVSVWHWNILICIPLSISLSFAFKFKLVGLVYVFHFSFFFNSTFLFLMCAVSGVRSRSHFCLCHVPPSS